MQFNSFDYLLLLSVTVALFHGLPGRWRPWLVLAASLVFYASWSAPFLLVLVANAGVDFVAARRIHASEAARTRRRWLWGSVCANVAMLGFFKYANFVLENLRWLPGGEALPPHLEILLPLGISFFTFQSMAYTIDVYRRRIEPEPSFRRYFLFIVFFPQLVAGPIERAARLLPQVNALDRVRVGRDDWSAGLLWIAWGLFQKTVLADNCAQLADPVFHQPGRWGGAWHALAAYAFTFQVYFDFAGYVDIARGSARLLGVRLVRNFNLPFLAEGPADLWRRWHITLSEWFRDYVYVPLGGNRRGPWVAMRNGVAVMLISGLWHGAAWHFVVWGLLHGLLLVVYRLGEPALRRVTGLLPAPLDRGARVLLFFHVWVLTLVMFRAETLPDTLAIWKGIASFAAASGASPGSAPWGAMASVAAAVALVPLLKAAEESRGIFSRGVERVPGYAAAFTGCVVGTAALAPSAAPAFVYFQF
ncbi:MBOAT family protein [Myxococcota bacterium]|nr:MBOAT family protein [Myxococcota bacterium]